MVSRLKKGIKNTEGVLFYPKVFRVAGKHLKDSKKKRNDSGFLDYNVDNNNDLFKTDKEMLERYTEEIVEAGQIVRKPIGA